MFHVKQFDHVSRGIRSRLFHVEQSNRSGVERKRDYKDPSLLGVNMSCFGGLTHSSKKCLNSLHHSGILIGCQFNL